MRLDEKLLAKFGDTPDPRTKVGKMLARGGVCLSPELARILALPRRDADDFREDLSPLYVSNQDDCGHENCPLCAEGPVHLWPKQNQMLWEAYERNGLFAPAGVGSGKTLPSFLLHDVMDAVRTVLLVKPRLREKLFHADLPIYKRHFNLPPIYPSPPKMTEDVRRRLKPGVYVVAYSELSLAHREGLLEFIDPDLVVGDEIHVLRYKNSARTKRFRRFFDAKPACRFCGMSGSTIKRSMRDYAHLIEIALKKDSPVPRGRTLFEFCSALDANVEKPLLPGKLLLFCQPGPDGIMESARDGFRRRLVETPGVVATQQGAVETSFELRARQLKLSPAIQDALALLEAYWEWDGVELPDALGMSRVSKQLCCGFFYRWRWEGGEASDEDRRWLAARNAWNKEVREYLKYHSVPGRDTPLQLWNAAERGEWRAASYAEWKAMKGRPEPEVDTVWIDKEPILRDVLSWKDTTISEDSRGIVWYEHLALGTLFREAGIPTFGAGEKDAIALAAVLDGNPSHPVITCSRGHATGTNMQRYDRALVTTPPAAGDEWQQLIGRELRPGQMADEVIYEVYQYTERLRGAMKQAIKDAFFQRSMTGDTQYLIIGDKTGFEPNVLGLED